MSADLAPKSLSAEVAAKIMLGWASGAKYAEACVSAGLTKAQATALKKDADWMGAYERARHQFVTGALLNIKGHGEKDWKATAWLLERLLPDRFSKREAVDVQVKVEALPWQSALTGEVIAADATVKTLPAEDAGKGEDGGAQAPETP